MCPNCQSPVVLVNDEHICSGPCGFRSTSDSMNYVAWSALAMMIATVRALEQHATLLEQKYPGSHIMEDFRRYIEKTI